MQTLTRCERSVSQPIVHKTVASSAEKGGSKIFEKIKKKHKLSQRGSLFSNQSFLDSILLLFAFRKNSSIETTFFFPPPMRKPGISVPIFLNKKRKEGSYHICDRLSERGAIRASSWSRRKGGSPGLCGIANPWVALLRYRCYSASPLPVAWDAGKDNCAWSESLTILSRSKT